MMQRESGAPAERRRRERTKKSRSCVSPGSGCQTTVVSTLASTHQAPAKAVRLSARRPHKSVTACGQQPVQRCTPAPLLNRVSVRAAGPCSNCNANMAVPASSNAQRLVTDCGIATAIARDFLNCMGAPAASGSIVVQRVDIGEHIAPTGRIGQCAHDGAHLLAGQIIGMHAAFALAEEFELAQQVPVVASCQCRRT